MSSFWKILSGGEQKECGEKSEHIIIKFQEYWDSKEDPKSFQRDHIYLQRKKDQIGLGHFISNTGCQKHWKNAFISSEWKLFWAYILAINQEWRQNEVVFRHSDSPNPPSTDLYRFERITWKCTPRIIATTNEIQEWGEYEIIKNHGPNKAAKCKESPEDSHPADPKSQAGTDLEAMERSVSKGKEF